MIRRKWYSSNDIFGTNVLQPGQSHSLANWGELSNAFSAIKPRADDIEITDGKWVIMVSFCFGIANTNAESNGVSVQSIERRCDRG